MLSIPWVPRGFLLTLFRFGDNRIDGWGRPRSWGMEMCFHVRASGLFKREIYILSKSFQTLLFHVVRTCSQGIPNRGSSIPWPRPNTNPVVPMVILLSRIQCILSNPILPSNTESRPSNKETSPSTRNTYTYHTYWRTYCPCRYVYSTIE